MDGSQIVMMRRITEIIDMEKKRRYEEIENRQEVDPYVVMETLGRIRELKNIQRKLNNAFQVADTP